MSRTDRNVAMSTIEKALMTQMSLDPSQLTMENPLCTRMKDELIANPQIFGISVSEELIAFYTKCL